MQLSFEQEQILLGAILGDACVERNGKNCRVKFDQSLAQEQYLLWKYNKLSGFSTKVRTSKVFDSRTQKHYSHALFDTKSLGVFNHFYELFYVAGRKVVPNNIVEVFTSPIALATWFLDDGAKRTDCNALRIHTNCYPRAEQALLLEMLQVNFRIQARLHKVKLEEFVIYIPSSEALKCCEIIRPVIDEIPSMRCKLIDRVTTLERRAVQAAS